MRYKRYSKYKKCAVEWLEEVPAHWTVSRLRHVAPFFNSNVDKKGYDGQQTVRLCNYTDVYNNEFITPSLPFMEATATEEEIRQFAVRRGDVLITKDSEDPADIGIPALIADDIPGVVCGYHLTIIRPADVITGRYLHRSIQSHPTKAHFFVEAPGITRYGLSQDAIGDTRVYLPPLSERTAISAALDRETARSDALIEKKTRFVELLKEKRQALIMHAVTKGLDSNVKMKDSGVEWIGKVPEHWANVPIRRVAKLESGHTPSRSISAYWENCTTPWFTLADVWQIRKKRLVTVTETAEKVSELGLANSSARKLPKGTVILSRTASIGFPAIMGCEMATSQDFAAWICGEQLNNEFLYMSLVAMRNELGRLTMGSTHKTIYMPDIEQLRCPRPPVPEQLRIVQFIKSKTTRIDSLIGKVERSIDLLTERRAALITAAVTGQIDLREEAA